MTRLASSSRHMRLDLFAGAGLIHVGEFDFDQLALADLLDAVKAEGAERAFNGLALRIEHTLLQRDLDLRLHHWRLPLPCIGIKPNRDFGNDKCPAYEPGTRASRRRGRRAWFGAGRFRNWHCPGFEATRTGTMPCGGRLSLKTPSRRATS